MNSGLSDYVEPARARGASLPPERDAGVAPEAVAADEAALMNILRLLNGVRRHGTLLPVERAFVLGAKAMFEELARVCDGLLAPPIVSSAAPDTPATETVASASRSWRRPTPGGARPVT